MASKPAFLSSKLRFAAFLTGSLALSQAMAAGDVNAYDALAPSGTVPAADDSSRNTGVTRGDLQQLQQESRQQALELATLKETITTQSLLIEQLKSVNAPTIPSPSTNDTDIAALKTKISEQTRTISTQQVQLNEAQRSAESNANDLNSLRQEISNLRSSVGRLDSQVSSLSSKVK